MGLAPSGNDENPGKSAVAKVSVPIFEKMGLAPSRNGENPGKSAVAKVPVPIFSQPRNMPALKGSAAKHFRSRIRENSDDFRAFRILTNSATIRSQAFSASGNASRRSPSGQCRSLHVNRRTFRRIRSRALPPNEPDFRSVACLKAAVRRRTTVDEPPAATRCSGLTPRPLRALPVFVPQSWLDHPASGNAHPTHRFVGETDGPAAPFPDRRPSRSLFAKLHAVQSCCNRRCCSARTRALCKVISCVSRTKS
jgi:hypothetical protein